MSLHGASAHALDDPFLVRAGTMFVAIVATSPRSQEDLWRVQVGNVSGSGSLNNRVSLMVR